MLKKFFIAAAVLFFSFTSYSQDNVSSKFEVDLVNVANHIEAINNASSNKKLKSIAETSISQIGLLPYKDIPDLLISLAFQELKKRKPVKSLLKELFDSIGNTVTVEHLAPSAPQNSSKIHALIDLLREKVTNPDYNEYRHILLNSLNAAKEAAKTRDRSELPSLFEPFAIVPEADAVLEQAKKIKIAQENELLLQSNSLATNEISTPEFDEVQAAKNYPKFMDELYKHYPNLKRIGEKEVKAGSASSAEIIYAGTLRIITDEVATNISTQNHFRIRGREDVVERVLLVYARNKQQNVVLIGSAGSGKTSIFERLAESIILGEVNQNEVFEFLNNAIILQTSTGKISSLAKTDKPSGQAQAIEEYFKSVKEVQQKIGRRIIVFIDEMHTLSPVQVDAIKPIIDSTHGGILLGGASTSPEWRAAMKHNPAQLRRTQEVAVRDLSPEEIFYIFNEAWMPTYLRNHGDVQISPDTIRLIIKKATLVYPDKGALDGAYMLAEDLFNYLRFKKNQRGAAVLVDNKSVYDFIRKEIGLPVDPTDFKGLEEYRVALISKIKNVVLDQDRAIDDIVNLWMEVLRNESPRGLRAAVMMGRSGTGKSEIATQLATHALGSPQRMFVIDGNEFQDANDIKLGIVFGVPGGVSFGQHTSGTLMEFLDDPSRGKHAGIILINEGDKANALFWVRLMEFLDRGIIQGGDNKLRKANKHLIIVTSNRGDSLAFPEDIMKLGEDAIRAHVDSLSEEDIKALLETKLSDEDKSHLPDSVVNRFDLFTITNLISPRVAKIIAEKIISYKQADFYSHSGLNLNIDPNIIDQFIKAKNPIKRGARSLVRDLAYFIETYGKRAMGSTPYESGDVISYGLLPSGKIKVTLNSFSVEAEGPRAPKEDRVIDFKATAPTQLVCESFFLSATR